MVEHCAYRTVRFCADRWGFKSGEGTRRRRSQTSRKAPALPLNSDLFCPLWWQTRATRSDEKLEAARPKVEELYDKEGARSPSQRDEV